MSEREGRERRTRCEEALRLLAVYLDGELDRDREAEMRHHLETCRHCYSRAEFEKRLKEQIWELRRRPVGPEFEAKIRTMIRGFPAA